MRSSGIVKIANGNYSLYMAMLFVASFMFAITSFSQMNSNNLGGQGWAQPVSMAILVWGGIYVSLTYMHYKTVYLYSNAYLLCLAIFHFGITLQTIFTLIVLLIWWGATKIVFNKKVPSTL